MTCLLYTSDVYKRQEKYVAIPDTSEHQLGLSVDINADTDKCSSEKDVYKRQALKFEVLQKVGDAVGNIQTYQL